MFKHFAILAFLGALLSGCVTAKPITVDKNEKRNIPLSLYTGLQPGETQTTHYIEGNPISFSGPHQWTHPETKKHLQVYFRDRMSRGTPVHQIFSVMESGDALERLFDSRQNRYINGNAKFPLGTWSQGESRVYPSTDGGDVTLSIVNIHAGPDGNGIVVQWKGYGGAGCWRYSFAPGKGMTSAYSC